MPCQEALSKSDEEKMWTKTAPFDIKFPAGIKASRHNQTAGSRKRDRMHLPIAHALLSWTWPARKVYPKI